MKDNIFLKYSAAAFDLCNDHRDTLLYTGLAVGQISDLVCNWSLPANKFVDIANDREMLRTAAWLINMITPSFSIAGVGATKEVDAKKCFWSALAFTDITNLALYTFSLAKDPHYFTTDPMALGNIAFIPISVYFAGGVRNVLKSYKEIMWDFPRKNKPPGSGNPLVEKFGELSRWLARPFQAAVPAPAGASRVLLSPPLNKPVLVA